MYIRRKVFSVLEDEMGEERLYSTSEYVLDCYENDIYDSEERYFSEDDEEKSRKGKKVAKAAGITAGSAVAAGAATYGGSKALNKIMQNKYDKIVGDSEAIAKLENSTIGKINKKAANLTAKVEDLPHGAKDAAGRLWDTTTKTWKSASDFAKVSAEKIKDGTVDAAGKVWNKTKGAWESISKAARMEAAELQGYLQDKKEEILGEIKDNKDRRKVAKAMKNHEKTVHGAVKEELAEAFNAPTVKRMWNGNYLKGKAEEATEKAAEKSKKAMSEKMRAVNKGVKGEELEKLAKSAANASKKAVNAKKVSEFVANHSKAISRGGMVAAPVAVAGTGYATYRAIKKHKDSKKESEKKND